MAFYQKYILPRFINFAMQKPRSERERADLIERASGVVLEIGFGSGLNLPFYRNVANLYAVDPSQELWELAAERVKKTIFRVEFIKGSAERISLADNTVDTAVSTWSLCSIPNPALAIKEVKRVLKPNGVFIFIEHGKSPSEKVSKWQNRLNPVWISVAGGCHLNREPDVLVCNEGFKIIELKKEAQGFMGLSHMYKAVAINKK